MQPGGVCLLVIAFLLTGIAGQEGDITNLCTWKGAFLPGTAFLPAEYIVRLSFTAGALDTNDSTADFTFQGTAVVNFTTKVTTSCVVFNGVNLNISQVSLTTEGDTSTLLCSSNATCNGIIRSANAGHLILDLGNNPLSAGDTAKLNFTYTAALTGLGVGIYRSQIYNYIDSSDQEQDGLIIASQHEDFYARQAVPRFDEPHLKARWTVSYEVPEGLTALANGHELSRSPSFKPGYVIIQFASTPIMSSYLFAVVIGQLEHLSTVSAAGYNVSVWSVLGKGAWLEHALEVATGALDFYTNWTGVGLPLSKFDYVAVPRKGGAMENWGLLQFDERRMLVDPETEDAYGRYISTNVICHETSHQWFGDYITLVDFGEYGVNEGITSFMEWKCQQAVRPEQLALPLRQLHSSPAGQKPGAHEGPRFQALRAAADPATPSLVPPRINNGSDPGAPADVQAYNFGSSFFFMLESAFGAEAVQAGLIEVLYNYAFSNLRLDTVLAILQSVLPDQTTPLSAEDSSTVQHSSLGPWIHSQAYPLVTVSNDGSLSVSQQAYVTYGPPDSDTDLSGTQPAVNATAQTVTWPLFISPVPFPLSPDAVDPVSFLISNDSALQYAAAGCWVLNSGASGIFRVQYPSSTLDVLIQSLSSLDVGTGDTYTDEDITSLVDAAALIDDTWALAFTGQVPIEDALRIAAAAGSAPASSTGLGQFLLIKPTLDGIQKLRGLLATQDSACQQAAAQLPHQLFNSQAIAAAGRLAPDGSLSPSPRSAADQFFDKLSFGPLLTATSFEPGRGDVATALSPWAEQTLQNGSTVNGDVRGAAYKLALYSAADSQSDVWAQLVGVWENEFSDALAEDALYALTAVTDPFVVNATADYVLFSEKPIADVPTLVQLLASFGSEPNAANVWNYFVAKWDDIVDQQDASGVVSILQKFPWAPSVEAYSQLAGLLDANADFDSDKDAILGSYGQRIAWASRVGPAACQALTRTAAAA